MNLVLNILIKIFAIILLITLLPLIIFTGVTYLFMKKEHKDYIKNKIKNNLTE